MISPKRTSSPRNGPLAEERGHSDPPPGSRARILFLPGGPTHNSVPSKRALDFAVAARPTWEESRGDSAILGPRVQMKDTHFMVSQR